jgi:hypothetical protein
VAAVQVEEVVDMRFLRKLDEGGFIESLFSTTGAR